MTANPWQYTVLMEGLLACACAIGLAVESIRRHPLRMIGYANIGVALIALSACSAITASLEGTPNAGTWTAAAGFGIYLGAVVGSWLTLAHGILRPDGRDPHPPAL